MRDDRDDVGTAVSGHRSVHKRILPVSPDDVLVRHKPMETGKIGKKTTDGQQTRSEKKNKINDEAEEVKDSHCRCRSARHCAVRWNASAFPAIMLSKGTLS